MHWIGPTGSFAVTAGRVYILTTIDKLNFRIIMSQLFDEGTGTRGGGLYDQAALQIGGCRDETDSGIVYR